jgi:hypothetical protein
MAGDRVARVRKWHELIERHGSEEKAHYAIRESPEWAMTCELYPFHLLDEGRRTLALDLMIAADKEAGELAVAVASPAGTPGRPGFTVTSDTLLKIFRQSLERARSTSKPPQPSYEKIAADNDVKRTWVTPIVKWAVKHQQEARRAIRLSEIPPRFSTIVRD